ncbi:MAG: MarR family transcriptional regulator [Lachnospiraceae bacterium]
MMANNIDKIEEFFLENFNGDRIFDSIERADYLFLYYISHMCERDGNENRAYLADIAEEMDLTILEVSKAVERLQQKDYVDWKTNEDRDKTYVKLTDHAVELMNDERARMKNFYGEIQSTIPKEDLKTMILTMKKITDIMKK